MEPVPFAYWEYDFVKQVVCALSRITISTQPPDCDRTLSATAKGFSHGAASGSGSRNSLSFRRPPAGTRGGRLCNAGGSLGLPCTSLNAIA